MVQPTQSNQPNKEENIAILESQIRECYGRVVWTHKTHEKCSDLYAEQLKNLKTFEIILSALTTTSLVISLFGGQKIGTIIGSIFSTVLLAINIYTRDYDLGKLSQSHAEVAHKLWNVRESYLSLIADIKLKSLSVEEIKAARDKLQEMVASIYESAPRTNFQAYKKASQALNESGQVNSNEEMTFSDEEIDRFLPKNLRQNKS